MKAAKHVVPCPCGGLPVGTAYRQCCGRLIDDAHPALDAEVLMRSRYTAYALGIAEYVLATWHRTTRPISLVLDPPGTPHGIRWLRLQVHEHLRPDPDHAEVRFTARYRESGKAQQLAELSRFIREDGIWFYADGDVTEN